MGTMMSAMLALALAGGAQFQGPAVMPSAGFEQMPLQQQPPQNPPQNPQNPQRGGRGPAPPMPGGAAPIQELQEMFDAFALVQAQRIMQLNDEQYVRFFPKMKRLQDVRRQHGRQRIRIINLLRRGYGPERAEDAALTDLARQLDELDAKFELEVRSAKAAVDETLTVRQRAAFRFFEQDMEVQKVDYLTRARQPGRQ
jgi:hypothetical protein